MLFMLVLSITAFGAITVPILVVFMRLVDDSASCKRIVVKYYYIQ